MLVGNQDFKILLVLMDIWKLLYGCTMHNFHIGNLEKRVVFCGDEKSHISGGHTGRGGRFHARSI
jgi:hypothetical protein